MPITPDNFESFFIGMSAEAFVASRLAMVGFEASRLAPDAGVDLLVTNIARRRILDEPPLAIEVQVKSALLLETAASTPSRPAGRAFFWMDEAERDYLMADPRRVTTFVIFHSMRQIVDPDTFHYHSSRVDRLIEQDAADFQDHLLARNGRRRPDGGFLSVLRSNRFETELFWLNGRQIETTIEAGLWQRGPKGGVRLTTQLDDGDLSLGRLSVVPEVRDLTHMFGCGSEAYLAEGRFSYDHL